MSGKGKRKSIRRSTAVAQQGSHETRSGNVGSDSIVKSAPRKVRKVSVLTLGAYSLSEAQWDIVKNRLSPDVRRELQERVDSGVKGQPLTAKIIDDLLFNIPSGRQPLQGAIEAAAWRLDLLTITWQRQPTSTHFDFALSHSRSPGDIRRFITARCA